MLACETTLMPSAFVDVVSAAVRGIRHQDNRLALNALLILRHVEVQPVLQPANQQRLRDHIRDRVVHSSVTDREVIHILRQSQSGPLAHQAVAEPDEEHVEDGAGKDRSCNDGRVGCHWLRHRTPQSNAALKAEDQKNDPVSPNGTPISIRARVGPAQSISSCPAAP